MLQVSGNTGAPTLRLGAGVAPVGDNQRVGGLRSLNSLGGTRKPIKPLTATRLRASRVASVPARTSVPENTPAPGPTPIGDTWLPSTGTRMVGFFATARVENGYGTGACAFDPSQVTISGNNIGLSQTRVSGACNTGRVEMPHPLDEQVVTIKGQFPEDPSQKVLMSVATDWEENGANYQEVGVTVQDNQIRLTRYTQSTNQYEELTTVPLPQGRGDDVLGIRLKDGKFQVYLGKNGQPVRMVIEHPIEGDFTRVVLSRNVDEQPSGDSTLNFQETLREVEGEPPTSRFPWWGYLSIGAGLLGGAVAWQKSRRPGVNHPGNNPPPPYAPGMFVGPAPVAGQGFPLPSAPPAVQLAEV